jgi:hypothetical protein
MAQYAELLEQVKCTKCKELITSSVCFQWGRIPNSYNLGEKINWMRHKNGEIVPSFIIYNNKDKWNSGEPSIKNLIALDSNFFAPEVKPKCFKCGFFFDGIGIEIVDEIIVSVFVMAEGELLKKFGVDNLFVDIITIEDKKYIARYDLYNPIINHIS